jgi:tRNA(Ile)-lysidine synthase
MAKNDAVEGVHRRVKTALVESGLSGRRIVVAVSGGPDSLALLHALHHLREDLHGGHLNHGLRGEASNADAVFVAETFRRLDIPLAVEAADVRTYRQKHGLSLEEAARDLRHEFLARIAAQTNADAIALGHTAEDQAETVLMHIIRGSGLTGLRGMRVVTRRNYNGTDTLLVRPLLEVSRSETVAYCRALNLEPRQDESNMSLALTRNRVRRELLPTLEGFNPSIRGALIRLSRSAAEAADYIEGEIDTLGREIVRMDENGVVLGRRGFARLAPAIQSHLLRRAMLTAKGDLADVEQKHVVDMARLMSGPTGKSLDLPGGVRFSVGYHEARLTRSRLDQCPLPALKGEQSIRISGETLLPGWRIVARLSGQRGQDTAEPTKAQAPGLRTDDTSTESTDFGQGLSPTSYSAVLDRDSLGGSLWVRSRIPGDRFQPLGMSQSKKLQDFLVDSKIPRQWRDRVPLVISPRGIVWVVGWRIAEWAKVRDHGARRLEIRFLPR